MVRRASRGPDVIAPAKTGYQHHHLLPLALARRAQIAQFLASLGPVGFRLTDRQANCLWLPAEERLAWRTGSALHRGPHPRYTEVVAARVERIRSGGQGLSASQRELLALRRLCRLQRVLAHILSGAGPRLVQLNRRDPLRLFQDYSQLDAAIGALHGVNLPVSADG
ncbi:AHH domain-containing protein [Sphingomonas lacunae]|uniref:AHH domain-containing protein n=2 Tax=Sphingomonas lacunae TaxID=2698828 RepID=A0A6M4AYS4_9SPHN|nr:AHH domain-containing protein [Sphingomonas lacunae]QJQ33199.1 AHH domain-containing protein [Sphingomonas lacunae]